MSDPSERFDRRWRWLTGLALVAYAAAAFYGRQRGLAWGGDDADYALLAQGLRDFRYHDQFLVGAPPHVTYPPGYPALLAIWGGVFGDTIGTLTALNVLLTVAALGITAHLVATYGSWRLAAVSTLLLVANPHILQYGGQLLAEAPMLFFGAGAIWFARREGDRRSTGLAIACAVLCALSRSAGVTVIGAIGLYWLFRRRFGAALLLAAFSSVFVGGWFLWARQASAGGAQPYVEQFVAGYNQQDVLSSWLAVLRGQWTGILGSYLPDVLGLPLTGATRWDNVAWASIAVGGTAIGIWTIWRRFPLVILVLVAYGAILSVWPWASMRLLVPMVPIIVPLLLVGVWRAGSLVSARVGLIAVTGVAIAMFGGAAWRSAQTLPCDRSIFSDMPACVRESEAGLGKAIRYIDQNVPKDATIMVRRGELTHYYTGNLTVKLPRMPAFDSITPSRLLDQRGVDFVVATTAYEVRIRSLGRLLEEACDRMTTEFRVAPHTLVLAVRPAGTPLAENACADARIFVDAVGG